MKTLGHRFVFLIQLPNQQQKQNPRPTSNTAAMREFEPLSVPGEHLVISTYGSQSLAHSRGSDS